MDEYYFLEEIENLIDRAISELNSLQFDRFINNLSERIEDLKQS